jgi:excisionase family DNA binding protein
LFLCNVCPIFANDFRFGVLQATFEGTGTARGMLADSPSSQTLISKEVMEESKVLQAIEELKALTLLAAKNTLTLDDVCMLYGFSKSTIYKMTSAKAIPHYRRGKVLFFDKGELDQWAKECRINTEAEAEAQALVYCLGK